MSGLQMTMGLPLGGGSGFAFSPISRSPLVWLKSNIGVTQAAGSATAWADQSGHANNFGTGGGGGGPNTYTASDAKLNNAPSLVPSASGIQNLLVQAQPVTVYVAGWTANTTNDLFGSGTGRTSIGGLGAPWYCDAATVLSGGTADTNAHAFCAVFNGASSVLYVDHSGSPIASGAAGANSVSTPVIGGPFTAAGGGVAELIIIAGADTAAQVAQMFRYFTSRGLGITAS